MFPHGNMLFFSFLSLRCVCVRVRERTWSHCSIPDGLCIREPHTGSQTLNYLGEVLSKLSSPSHPSLSVFLSFSHVFLLHHHRFDFLIQKYQIQLFLLYYFLFTQYFFSHLRFNVPLCLYLLCLFSYYLWRWRVSQLPSHLCLLPCFPTFSPSCLSPYEFSPSSSTSHCLCGVSGNRRGIVASTHHPIIFSNANRERQPVNKVPF